MMKAVSTRLCHSVSPARIGSLMRFGFTERQARFLAHVLVFSGVFIERQYRAFREVFLLRYHPSSFWNNPADGVYDDQFDYSKAKPNRFASRMAPPVVAIVLESDVAAVFDSSAKVNAQLRAAISARTHRKQVPRARAHHRRVG